MSLKQGDNIGPYEILEAAGAGGMGEVYKAKDSRLDRTVAIKTLHNQMSANADLKARFEREAKAISSLNHPNICILYDIGEHDGTDYLVMEYLEGETLADRLKRDPLGHRETLDIAIQIADALDKAHRQGLVHRDLKPANIMLTRDGAKLLDFGLAKLQVEGGVIEGVSGITRTTPLTGAGTILGTVPYMAPEQLEGKEADARTDIFAFGSVLYEMATGRRAFEGESQASLIASIMKVHPESVSRIQPLAPPMLERVISQCLEKDPDQRWQTAGDLKRALQWIVEGGSQAGIPVPVARRRKLREVLGISFTSLLIIITLGLAWLYYSQMNSPKRVVKSELTAPRGTELGSFGGGACQLSPDGSKIIFSAFDSSGTDDRLWVRSLNSLTAVPLMGTENGTFPFWSPDGKYVAFFSNSKLRKILATGGPVLTICDAPSGRGGTWNEDGIILFTPTSAAAIFRVPAAGGKAEQLTTLDTTTNEITHRYAQFLPDGEHFLFFVRLGGSDNDGIAVGDISTGEYKTILVANSNPCYSQGHLLYVYQGTLMAQPFDANALELKGEAFPIAESVSSLENWSRGVFSVSQNGDLAYRTGQISNGTAIVMADRNGNLLDTIDAAGDHYNIRLFPDEKRLAMDIEEPSQSASDVWVVDLTRKIKTRISFDEENDDHPLVSPDGTKIVFRSRRSQEVALYMKNADGTGQVQKVRTFDHNIWLQQWAPDGSGIVFIRGDGSGDAELWIASLDSSEAPTPLRQLPESQYDAAFSPDMRWLAYGSDETGKEQIYVTSYPSLDGRWQVSVNEGDRPHWSADGKKLYFLSNKDEIMEVDIDGTGGAFKVGEIRKLFNIENASRPGRIYDVSGDGQTFFLNLRPQGSQSNQFILVQNWLSEFKE